VPVVAVVPAPPVEVAGPLVLPTLDVEDTRALQKSQASSPVLCDEFISERLTTIGYDTAANKEINRVACRLRLRSTVVSLFRDTLTKQILAGELAPNTSTLSWGKRLQWGASQYLTALSQAQRAYCYKACIQNLEYQGDLVAAEDTLCHIFRYEVRQTGEKDDKDYWLRANTGLLTYQGKWGLIPWDATLIWAHSEGLKVLCEVLSKDRIVEELFVDLVALATDVKEEYNLKAVTCCIELCCETLEKDNVLRVHLHLCMEAQPMKQIKVKNVYRLAFRGSFPVKGSSANGGYIATKSATNAASAHYYCRMPKKGMIRHWGTHDPFKHYRINCEWITAFLQAGKLDDVDAIMEYSKCWKSVKMNVENVEYNVQLRKRRKLEERVEIVLERTAAKRSIRKYLPLVEEVYLPHMATEAERHMVLVLDGPSGVGKTSYVKGLCSSAKAYLEINCMNLRVSANLREVVETIETICFDEASVEWALDNKKILQGPEFPVSMGDSNTGMYSYRRFLNGIKMVICSNKWAKQVSKLKSEEDKAYVHKNFLYVYCDELLYDVEHF
jgi:hypothetical protein